MNEKHENRKRKIALERILAYVGMAGVFGYAFGLFGNTASLVGMGVGIILMLGAEHFSKN